jgi:hypothetical protein
MISNGVNDVRNSNVRPSARSPRVPDILKDLRRRVVVGVWVWGKLLSEYHSRSFVLPRRQMIFGSSSGHCSTRHLNRRSIPGSELR